MRIETGSQAGTVVEVHDGNVQSPNPGAYMMHGMMQSGWWLLGWRRVVVGPTS